MEFILSYHSPLVILIWDRTGLTRATVVLSPQCFDSRGAGTCFLRRQF